MGAAAQIGEVALTVQGERFAGGNAFDDLGLVVLAEPLEVGDRLIARQRVALDRDVLLDELMHAGLDLLEIFGRERTVELEVVVKAVFNGRSDRHLGLREEFLDGLRHQV